MYGNVVEGIAYILNTLTILSCLFLKVPQIMYIKEKQSADGIYLQAMLMELTGFSIMTLYNYTNGYGLMTYLEYPIILVQLYVMFYYVLKYKDMLHLAIVPIAVATYVITVCGFGFRIVPKEMLSYLVPFCTPLSGFAKVTYIYGIINLGNADSVSLTTWIISVATNMARIFTIYVDSADGKLITNFVISTLLSSGVLGTAMFYQGRTAASAKTPQKHRSRSRSHND